MKRKAMGLALALCLFSAVAAQAQTMRVTEGSISKTVFGSGSVLAASQPGVYAKIDAEVLDWYAEVGDAVKAGDVLVQMENDELAATVYQLESDIQPLQEDMLYTETHKQYKYKQAKYEDGRLRYDVNTGEPLMEKYSDEITVRAPCDGRVMAVYIEEGSDALAVYREHGCVVMLSTDGRMKVELDEHDPMGLVYDQKVRVVGDGVDAEGTVVELRRYGTQATIQITDDSFPMDTPVAVYTEDGAKIGEGILEINKPMAVSAYGGTVKGVAWNVQVGKYLERYDVIARIDWDKTPLFYENDVTLHEYMKKHVELEKAREKLEKLTIVAPCDGVVASVDIEKGDSVTSGTKLMSIVEDGAGLELILAVDELDIPMVEPGQTVTVYVDALEGVTLSGVVEKIAPLGNTGEEESSSSSSGFGMSSGSSGGVTTYDVYVQLTGDVDERIKSGMNVTGEILVSSEQNAICVPAEALIRSGKDWYVQLQSGEYQQVTLGVTTDSQVQILTGLSEGDVIMY